MYIGTDITPTMNWIVNMFIQGFRNVFNWLSSFEFAGTNLLSVIITITILSIFIPVLLSIPNNRSAFKKGRESTKGGKNDK